MKALSTAVLAVATGPLMVAACGGAESTSEKSLSGTGAAAASATTGNGGADGMGGSAGMGGAAGSGGAPGGGGRGGSPGTGSGGGGAEGGGGSGGDGPSSSATGGGGPVSMVCGDAIRDPVTEECDDGPGNAEDACTETCQVTDFWASPMSDAVLDGGRHPVAGAPDGFAVAFVDRSSAPDAPRLAVFGPHGAALGPPWLLGAGLKHAEPSSPVVAALPNGAFAVAWTDLDGDGDQRGIALQRIDPLQPSQPEPVHANEATSFNQYDADALWTGSELVIAWVDDADAFGMGDLLVRTFDADLLPTSGAMPLAATTEAEGRVALAPFAGGWAAAWRTASTGVEYVTVGAAGSTWEVGPILPGPATDAPALLELDATHILVVYTEADPMSPGLFSLSGAIIDLSVPGTLMGFPLAPASTPAGQTHPNAVRVGSRLFVAWRNTGVDALAEDLFLLELSWSSATQTLDAGSSALALPRWSAHQAGDQRRPGLAATPLAPDGALVGCWEDWAAGPSAPNVRVELMPTPILRF